MEEKQLRTLSKSTIGESNNHKFTTFGKFGKTNRTRVHPDA